MKRDALIVPRDRRISERLLQSFLEDVVNATQEQSVAESAHFFKRYPKFFPTLDQDVRVLLPFINRQPGARSCDGPYLSQSREVIYRAVVWELRDRLRQIWKSHDQYTADWRVFLLQNALHGKMGISTNAVDNLHMDDTGPLPPPPKAPINQALTWLRKKFANLKLCANEACTTPYFVRAKGKQRFCSSTCAEIAQKEHKAKWWAEHGAKWRESRTSSASKAVNSKSKRRIKRSETK